MRIGKNHTAGRNPAKLQESKADLTSSHFLMIEPDANITPDLAANAITKINEGFDSLRPRIEAVAHDRAEELLLAHRRVRTAARLKGIRYRVEPHLPPDVLGIYVYLPVI